MSVNVKLLVGVGVQTSIVELEVVEETLFDLNWHGDFSEIDWAIVGDHMNGEDLALVFLVKRLSKSYHDLYSLDNYGVMDLVAVDDLTPTESRQINTLSETFNFSDRQVKPILATTIS